jgi:hypothetical protein
MQASDDVVGVPAAAAGGPDRDVDMDPRVPTGTSNQNRGGDSSDTTTDVFTSTIERILQTSESRGESHLQPFTAKELSALSALCTQQSSRKGSLDADLGFADVDASLAGQLVEGLQKHVTLASSIDFVQKGYKALQSSSVPIETVRIIHSSMHGESSQSTYYYRYYYR